MHRDGVENAGGGGDMGREGEQEGEVELTSNHALLLTTTIRPWSP